MNHECKAYKHVILRTNYYQNHKDNLFIFKQKINLHRLTVDTYKIT